MSIIDLKLSTYEPAPDRRQIDACAHWIILQPKGSPLEGCEPLPYARELDNRLQTLSGKIADQQPVTLDLPNAHGSRVAYTRMDPLCSSFHLLDMARKLVAVHKHGNARKLGLVVHGFSPPTAERMAEALIAAVWAATAVMPNFKQDPPTSLPLQKVNLYGLKAVHAFKRTRAEAEGNALARYLSMLPSNRLDPGLYRKEIGKLAREYGWKMEFMGIRALERMQAGAFLAVAQGSPIQDAGIVRLQYRPEDRSPRHSLALVGKGICYDTGGTNLKTARSMFGMHEDMQGSAVALGTLVALTRLQENLAVDCYLAIAMNHIGPQAYKPNDVVTASDGTTIEVVHTDAEGRMVLADTLAIASSRKPSLIIDYATLTGSCIHALGTNYSGVFSNRKEFHPLLIEAGRRSGERVWPFPLDDDYDKPLESTIADIRQCALDSGPDHILAARFLQRFVKHEVPWIHLDLSASTHKGGLAHIPTDTSGFGIRFTLNLLLDQQILKEKDPRLQPLAR